MQKFKTSEQSFFPSNERRGWFEPAKDEVQSDRYFDKVAESASKKFKIALKKELARIDNESPA